MNKFLSPNHTARHEPPLMLYLGYSKRYPGGALKTTHNDLAARTTTQNSFRLVTQISSYLVWSHAVCVIMCSLCWD